MIQLMPQMLLITLDVLTIVSILDDSVNAANVVDNIGCINGHYTRIIAIKKLAFFIAIRSLHSHHSYKKIGVFYSYSLVTLAS
jgi:hypothetical protein